MKRFIGYTAVLCLLAATIGCGGASSTGTLAYISNSTGNSFTVFSVNTNGTLSTSSISPQVTPASPKIVVFSPNGQWAYFLDAAGAFLYGYTRSGNGALGNQIGTRIPMAASASSLAVSTNSQFLYVSIPGNQQLATYSIEPSTGILNQVGSSQTVGYAITQLVMAPGGGVLFGLSPSQQAVVSWTLSPASGFATQNPNTVSVGLDPVYMVLSGNGSFMYVLDHTATTVINNVANCGNPPRPMCTSSSGPSPNIYGYNVSGATLTPMPGTSNAGNVFNENADLITGAFPANPITGSTSNDSRFLFVANQGSSNTTVFRVNTVSGQLTEVLGTYTVINGIPNSTASPFGCLCSPSFLAVAKANNAVYLLDPGDPADAIAARIVQFSINQGTGQMRALAPPAISLGTANGPVWITIR